VKPVACIAFLRAVVCDRQHLFSDFPVVGKLGLPRSAIVFTLGSQRILRELCGKKLLTAEITENPAENAERSLK
jgi:hypothetical protein